MTEQELARARREDIALAIGDELRRIEGVWFPLKTHLIPLADAAIDAMVAGRETSFTGWLTKSRFSAIDLFVCFPLNVWGLVNLGWWCIPMFAATALFNIGMEHYAVRNTRHDRRTTVTRNVRAAPSHENRTGRGL